MHIVCVSCGTAHHILNEGEHIVHSNASAPALTVTVRGIIRNYLVYINVGGEHIKINANQILLEFRGTIAYQGIVRDVVSIGKSGSARLYINGRANDSNAVNESVYVSRNKSYQSILRLCFDREILENEILDLVRLAIVVMVDPVGCADNAKEADYFNTCDTA